MSDTEEIRTIRHILRDFEKGVHDRITEIDAKLDERALADDLADVLSRVTVGWKPMLGVDLAEYPDVVRVMARYREARGR